LGPKRGELRRATRLRGAVINGPETFLGPAWETGKGKGGARINFGRCLTFESPSGWGHERNLHGGESIHRLTHQTSVPRGGAEEKRERRRVGENCQNSESVEWDKQKGVEKKSQG